MCRSRPQIFARHFSSETTVPIAISERRGCQLRCLNRRHSSSTCTWHRCEVFQRERHSNQHSNTVITVVSSSPETRAELSIPSYVGIPHTVSPPHTHWLSPVHWLCLYTHTEQRLGATGVPHARQPIGRLWRNIELRAPSLTFSLPGRTFSYLQVF